MQGVFFRASCAREAQRLGVTGSAVNLTDGRVEVVACGDDTALDELRAWLGQGPRGARVEHVEALATECVQSSAFTTG